MYKLLFAFLLALTSLHADTWRVEMDNDIIFQSDDSYTGGLNITWVSDEYVRGEDSFSCDYTEGFRDTLETIPYLNFNEKRLTTTIGIQEVIITPTDINETEPIYDDIPYIGALMAHFSLFAWDDAGFDQYRLTLGVIGEKAHAKEVQNGIHTLIGNSKAQGWDNQLGEKYFFGVGYLHGHRMYENRFSSNMKFEWFTSVFGDVGNANISGGVGTLVRYGQNLPRNYDVPSSIFNASPNNILNLKSRNDSFGWSIDLGISGSYIYDLYIFEEAIEEGYEVEDHDLVGVAKIGLSMYYANIRFAMDMYPVFDGSETSSSYGRFSIAWYY